MASNSFSRLAGAALMAVVVLGALPIPPAQASSPTPLTTLVPFALPVLEGAQVKVELGYGGPHGDATSLWGVQPALVSFSVWWWDTGPPTQARLFVDGVAYAMTAAPGGDSDDTNGSLYVAEVNGTTLAFGDHSYYFDFTGPSGSLQYYPSGTLANLRLDSADRFLSEPLLTIARQVKNDKGAGSTVKTLRDAVARTANLLDPQMATSWDSVDGYTYADRNHHIIQPVGATAGDLEAFVTATGASQARYTDTGGATSNTQPAIKQALVMKGVLVATTLFNTSDIEIRTETMVVNGTTYKHPFLRVKLNDLSELAGDGPVNGDNSMDVDLWGAGLSSAVPIGSHFGEDYNATNDALWAGSVGWPPVDDTSPEVVLSSYTRLQNVTTPDGTVVGLYVFDSSPHASAANPLAFLAYWTDEPMVFDGLSSYQTAGVDLFYDWKIDNTVYSALGPVWTQTVGAVGQYSGTLSVRDIFGQVDDVTIQFFQHGKTRVVRAMTDVVFQEDAKQQIDLRQYFADDDGFGTIQFNFSLSPSGQLFYDRFPSNSPWINISAPANACPKGELWVNATDGVSPTVSQHVLVNVTCVNDQPVFASNVPTAVSFPEDTAYSIPNMHQYVTDADPQDVLVWSFVGQGNASGTYDAANDTMTFTAPPNWNGIDTGRIYVTDGTVTIDRNCVVQVLAVNDPPVIVGAVPEFTVAEDSAAQGFEVASYFSDPDGDNLVPEPEAGVGLEVGYNVGLRQVWFQPLPDFNGAAWFTLRARDVANTSVAVRVNVTVTPVNDPPVVRTVNPPSYVTAFEGDVITFTMTADDVDSSTLIYSAELDGVPQGQSPAGTFDWRTDFESAGRHRFNITVSDGAGGAATHSWQVQVENRNRPPSVVIETNGSARYRAGDMIHLVANAADPDGDALVYTWTFGGLMQPRGGAAIDVRFPSAGNYTVKVTVTDGHDSTDAQVVLAVTFELPPDTGHNSTAPAPRPQGFLSGLEIGAVLAAAGAAAVIVAVVRRRRSP